MRLKTVWFPKRLWESAIPVSFILPEPNQAMMAFIQLAHDYAFEWGRQYFPKSGINRVPPLTGFFTIPRKLIG